MPMPIGGAYPQLFESWLSASVLRAAKAGNSFRNAQVSIRGLAARPKQYNYLTTAHSKNQGKSSL